MTDGADTCPSSSGSSRKLTMLRKSGAISAAERALLFRSWVLGLACSGSGRAPA